MVGLVGVAAGSAAAMMTAGAGANGYLPPLAAGSLDTHETYVDLILEASHGVYGSQILLQSLF